ncbi:hypothetical protein FIBSPDRAFT_848153 [Athelia psychrophila]|uniref:Uncharacterized protein n=1 Tax=Athelia psychrophila TaxID=1759441 RepID=A0A166VMS3_9AGAM|nr:hypothetical protein FIBSPDRAFT_848153 [Fibularhizoctonia sp. CBS 109695]
MPSYYVPSPHGSHHGHQAVPVMYTPSQQSQYLSPQQPYYQDVGHSGGMPYIASHSGSHRSRNSHQQPHYSSSHRSHSRHGGGHSHGHSSGSRSHGRHHSGRQLTFGERVKRFFGFGRSHHHSRKSHQSKGWSFFGGRSSRDRFMDTRTGMEVDRHGRPVYKV